MVGQLKALELPQYIVGQAGPRITDEYALQSDVLACLCVQCAMHLQRSCVSVVALN